MDVFFQGVEVTVMGFIVVIAVLAFICFVLMIFNFIANLENKKAKDFLDNTLSVEYIGNKLPEPDLPF